MHDAQQTDDHSLGQRYRRGDGDYENEANGQYSHSVASSVDLPRNDSNDHALSVHRAHVTDEK